ncbi:MAG: hypothetical protein FI710_14240 [SAR202 cluster bacterium]|nr:hypothetical protein [Dehalococcoidia bacterium]MQG56131.1 hypothetical protein [SAR202 cluster bacterium]
MARKSRNLHQVLEEQPKKLKLADDEVSTKRTFDESGYQFLLLYNTTGNHFTWVLNEEEIVPDELVPVEDDLLVGRRSGFAFWVGAAHPIERPWRPSEAPTPPSTTTTMGPSISLPTTTWSRPTSPST